MGPVVEKVGADQTGGHRNQQGDTGFFQTFYGRGFKTGHGIRESYSRMN
jgi:hypothetical protein